MSTPTPGRVVVITGSNAGIGYQMLRSLLEDGYQVAGFDVETSHLQSLQEANPDQLLAFHCDVTVDGDVETAIGEIIDEWGRIDILVNNAAILDIGFVEDQTLEDTKRVFEVNFFRYVRTIRVYRR